MAVVKMRLIFSYLDIQLFNYWRQKALMSQIHQGFSQWQKADPYWGTQLRNRLATRFTVEYD